MRTETKQDRLLLALKRMQKASENCTDLEVAYLGYSMIQTAAVIHNIPVENLLLECATNVNAVPTKNGIEVQMNVGETDD